MKLSIAIFALLHISSGIVLEKKHYHRHYTHPVPAEQVMLRRNGSEYPSPDIRGPQPQNAHPDSTFSSHLHNDWTHVQLKEPYNSSPDLYYEGQEYIDRRFFEYENPSDFVQINKIGSENSDAIFKASYTIPSSIPPSPITVAVIPFVPKYF